MVLVLAPNVSGVGQGSEVNLDQSRASWRRLRLRRGILNRVGSVLDTHRAVLSVVLDMACRSPVSGKGGSSEFSGLLTCIPSYQRDRSVSSPLSRSSRSRRVRCRPWPDTSPSGMLADPRRTCSGPGPTCRDGGLSTLSSTMNGSDPAPGAVAPALSLVEGSEMSAGARPTTLHDLRNSGWKSRPVKEEIRSNFLRMLHQAEELFPGIIVYADPVIPEINLGLLAGHDLLFLGEKGQ